VEKEKGKRQDWNLTLARWKDIYNDKQLAAVLTYIRSAWGNNAPPAKPEQVAPPAKTSIPARKRPPICYRFPFGKPALAVAV
jgi:hypothetical protein